MIDLTQNRRRVQVVDYDPSWPDTFEALRRQVWPAVHDVALSIEHVGSTAVPGLAAATEYGRLKKQLAAAFPDDVDRYSAAKTDCILEMLRSASVPEAWLQAIREANLPPPRKA